MFHIDLRNCMRHSYLDNNRQYHLGNNQPNMKSSMRLYYMSRSQLQSLEKISRQLNKRQRNLLGSNLGAKRKESVGKAEKIKLRGKIVTSCDQCFIFKWIIKSIQFKPNQFKKPHFKFFFQGKLLLLIPSKKPSSWILAKKHGFPSKRSL